MTEVESTINNIKDTGSLRYTLLIGLGFMTTGISWSMYNTYVPYMLEKTWFFKEEAYIIALPALFIIGFIMTLDNIAAWIIQPWIGAKSDNTWHSKWGRRMPYLLIGIPVSAMAFVLIPIVWWLFPGKEFSYALNSILPLFLFMIAINIFNVFMASYRSPVVALMPDLIPPKDRTKANGAINLMGGLGSVISFFGGKFIVNLGRSIGEPQGLGDEIGFIVGFTVVAIIMILALIVLKITIKESETPFGQEIKEDVKLSKAFNEVFSAKDKSGVFILFAILLWFTGYQAMETFFSLYGVYTLGFTNVEDAAFYLNAFAIPFLLMAVPAGLISARIGRSLTIKIGLIGILLALFPLAILPMRDIVETSGQDTALLILIGCLIFGGLSWALVNINSIVIVWEIGGEKRGAYTGLYYFFSMMAAVVGPPLVGLMLTVINGLIGAPGREMDFLFLASVIFLFLAFLAMFKVKSGELGQKLKA